MRIGINARLAGSGAGVGRAGVARYIDNLLTHLPAALGPDDRLIVAARPPAGDSAAPLARLTRHPAARIAWEQSVLPLLARRGHWDVLHSPVNVAPVLAGVPSVVTVHDLAFVTAGETMPAARRRYLTAMTARSVRQAARVIAVSASTARDLTRHFDVPPERIAVTPLAADARFRPLDADELAAFRRRAGIERPYLLSVGTREPRKNGATLIRAFARIAPEIVHDLVMVGPAGWMGGDLDRALAALPPTIRERVRLTGFVADADLPRWYAGAAAFAYPARYEGFGLPVLEAMACGAPVVTSDLSSLPEVSGDAALLVPPDDEAGLAAALLRLATDPALAADLGRRGLARAAEFSWERTAALTVAAYHAAMER